MMGFDPAAEPQPNPMLATALQDIRGQRAALWDITGTCNLRCKHCYQFDRYEYDKRGRYGHDLTFEQARTVLERLVEAGVTAIHFLGGEPLLRPDLPELIRLAKQHGIYVSINTNGLPLTAAKAEQLAACGTDQLMVSLDGATAGTNDEIRGQGTFAKAWRNLRAAQRAPGGGSMVVGIAFTATRTNSGELAPLFRMALDHDVELIHVVLALSAGNLVRFGKRFENDEALFLRCLDRALAEHGARMRDRLRVRIDLRLWPIEVLNRKHGRVLEPDPVGIRCQGGKGFLIVQADGRLGPCSASLDPLWNRTAQRRGHLLAEPECVHELPANGIDHSPILDQFYRFQADPETWRDLAPCQRCPYFRKLCEPCPLEHPDGHRVVDQCAWAESESRLLEAQLLASSLEVGGGCRLDGPSILRQPSNQRVWIGPMMAALLRELDDGERSLAMVLEQSFEPPLQAEQRDQVLNALAVLMAHGVVKRRPVPMEAPCRSAS